MSFILFILPYIVVGFFATLMAISIEGIMNKIGWTPGNTVVTAILTFVLSIAIELLKLPEPISLEIVDFMLVLIVMPVLANVIYLIKTIRQGRWWWLLEDDLEEDE